MLPLAGVLVAVLGFALRLNPLLVVVASAFATGFAAEMDPVVLISTLGRAFSANRYLAVAWLVLPLIGVLERAGLKVQAQRLVSRLRAATPGRILLLYFVARQLAAALGLTALGGHAQMVRPIVGPMALAAGERVHGRLPAAVRFYLLAHAAAADNIALFFGEDIFVAVGFILLMKGFFSQNGIDIEPLRFSLWALPTAACALAMHAARLARLDRDLEKRVRRTATDREPK